MCVQGAPPSVARWMLPRTMACPVFASPKTTCGATGAPLVVPYVHVAPRPDERSRGIRTARYTSSSSPSRATSTSSDPSRSRPVRDAARPM